MIKKLFNKNYANVIVITNYLIKASQALFILYLIEIYISAEELNIALNIYFILGFVLMFDFGIPNVIARNIIRQLEVKYDHIKIGYGFKILLASLIISIIAAYLYIYSFLGYTNLIPIVVLLILVRKCWSLNNAILFGFNKVNSFRTNELILELFRIITTISFLIIFKSFESVLIAEIISFSIILIKSFFENKNIDFNFKNESPKFYKIQLNEIWRGGLLFISSYLSYNLIYSADLSNIDLNIQNIFFFNLKMFFSLKTISQLPITNKLPKIASAYTLEKTIPRKIISSTLILSFLIFIAGSFLYGLLCLIEVDFVFRYYDNSFSLLILLICFGELLHGLFSNIAIAAGKIPFWISSSTVFLIQFSVINLIDYLSISLILILMAIRPIVLIAHSTIFTFKLIK